MTKKQSNKKGAPDAIDIHVGKRLRVRRSLLGYSQEKLSDFVGLTFQQIQKYERGLNRISASRLYQFSKILNVPVEYFFDELNKDQGTHRTTKSGFGFAEDDQDQTLLTPIKNNEKIPADIINKKETVELIRAYYAIENQDARRDWLKVLKSMSAGN